MKKIFFIFAAVLIASFAATSSVRAVPSKNETRLSRESSSLDKDSGKPEGEKAIIDDLKKEFNVNDTVIQGLRDKKMGYGEIAIALSFAEKMQGRISDANINKIISMRHGPPIAGWGRIAKKLGIRLGPVINRLEKVRAESFKETERLYKKEKIEKTGGLRRSSVPKGLKDAAGKARLLL